MAILSPEIGKPLEATPSSRSKSFMRRAWEAVTHPIKGPLIATAATVAVITGAQQSGLLNREAEQASPVPSREGLRDSDGFHPKEQFAAAGAGLEGVSEGLNSGDYKAVQVAAPEGNKTILVTKDAEKPYSSRQ